MESSLCLVDGTFELFRGFYGAARRRGGDPKTGGAIALGRSLEALRKSGEFSHVAVAFDTVIESFRNDLIEGYKTGEGIDQDLFGQFPLAEELTAALGFTVLSMVEFEADDGICAAAHQARESGDFGSVVIASPDKDLMQCVGGNVISWDRIRDVRYDEGGVKEKMGVVPASIPDFLALVGDTADGIPGVARWGARSTAQVLTEYKHLESIPRSADDWRIKVRGAQSLVDKLKEAEDDVLLYRKLATLRSDVPLP